MKSRPKSVSFVAITFGLLAVFIGWCSTDALLNYLRHIHTAIPLKGLIAFGVTVLYALTARGLWRLSSTYRVVAITLAVLNTLTLTLIGIMAPETRTAFATADVATLAGLIVGIFIWIPIFGSPIYILTRPRIAAIFEKRSSNQDDPPAIPDRR